MVTRFVGPNFENNAYSLSTGIFTKKIDDNSQKLIA